MGYDEIFGEPESYKEDGLGKYIEKGMTKVFGGAFNYVQVKTSLRSFVIVFFLFNYRTYDYVYCCIPAYCWLWQQHWTNGGVYSTLSGIPELVSLLRPKYLPNVEGEIIHL